MRLESAVRRMARRLVFSTALAAGAVSCQCGVGADSGEIAREVGRIRSPALREISGLVASRQHPDILWVHNDGSAGQLFAIAAGGRQAALVRVPTRMDDVEDIAIGPGPREGDSIYLGDIGDNDQNRRSIRLVRIAEPDLSQARSAEMRARDVEVFELKYPDARHDAEALMSDPLTGDLFIVTKEEDSSRLYRIGSNDLREDAASTLELVGHLQVAKVSGGDISPSGNFIVLRSEDRGWLWSRGPEESVADALQRSPRIVLTRGRGQGENGEAIGFRPDGQGYYTISEGEHESVYFFPLPPPVSGDASG